jgi:hypothetical protein
LENNSNAAEKGMLEIHPDRLGIPFNWGLDIAFNKPPPRHVHISAFLHFSLFGLTGPAAAVVCNQGGPMPLIIFMCYIYFVFELFLALSHRTETLPTRHHNTPSP